MTSEDMAKVLNAVRLCDDHIEASPIMARLAHDFPDFFDQISQMFDEEYGYDMAGGGRFNLSVAMTTEPKTYLP